MLNKDSVVKYLRMALALKDPTIETDEAYKFLDDDLWDIVQLVIPTHNFNYTVDNFPSNELYFAILLAKKEVYYRLATSSAPFYPLQAEGAELRKDYRFEHYMSLIRRVESEYELAKSSFESNKPIDVGDVILRRNHFTRRNYELATPPEVELKVDVIRENSIDISWTKFNPSNGMFKAYTIYVSTEQIYDEYLEEISKTATKLVSYNDIHRTKHRVRDLRPSTKYFIAVISEDMNGLKGISEEEVETLTELGVI